MGKRKYNGFDDFLSTNKIFSSSNENPVQKTIKNAMIAYSNLYGEYFGKDKNDIPKEYNIPLNHLSSLFQTIKMVNFSKKLEKENNEVLNSDSIKYSMKLSKYIDKLQEGNSLNDGETEYLKELGENDPLEKFRIEELLKCNANNTKINEFKSNIAQAKIYNNQYNEQINFEKLDKCLDKVIQTYGINKDSDYYNELTNADYFKINLPTKKEEIEYIKSNYNEEFTNFVTIVNEFNKRREKEILNKIDNNIDLGEYKEKFEYSYFRYNNPSTVRTTRAKPAKNVANKSEVLSYAVLCHQESKARMKNSLIKRIPILRWLSKDYRKERSLFNSSKAVIKELQGDTNLLDYIDQKRSTDEIYDMIDKISFKDKEIEHGKYIDKEPEEETRENISIDEKDISMDIDKVQNKETMAKSIETEKELETDEIQLNND